MTTQEALQIVIDEAMSSALGDNNQKVLEALLIAQEEADKLSMKRGILEE
jgi:hypothetical protein